IFSFSFFFFPHPPTPAIYTLSLHDALPIFSVSVTPWASTGTFFVKSVPVKVVGVPPPGVVAEAPPLPLSLVLLQAAASTPRTTRSEEHTSELQSRGHLVCRLLLEKKKKKKS